MEPFKKNINFSPSLSIRPAFFIIMLSVNIYAVVAVTLAFLGIWQHKFNLGLHVALHMAFSPVSIVQTPLISTSLYISS